MEATRIEIRPARPDDAETIVEFNLALARESEGRELDRSTLSAGVRQALRDPRLARYFLAENRGQVIGQMMLTEEWSDWRCGRFWWIQSVYVADAFRGQGVYQSLQRHVERLALETKEVCGLRLYVERNNRRAQAVYQRGGLTETDYLVYEKELRMPNSE